MNESQRKILRDINDSVPKQWWDNVIKKVWANPTIREMVDRGLLDPDVSPETKEKLEIVKKSPVYAETIDVVDEKIEKKIDEHLTRKVRQAIKNGSLPPLTEKDFDVRHLKNKGTKEEAPSC